MSSSEFIQGLAATADPVSPRKVSREVLALGAVATVQLIGAAFYFGTDAVSAAFARDGFHMVVKVGLFGALALGYSALAILSLDPAARRLGPWLGGGLAFAALIGVVGLDRQVGSSLATTFNPDQGMRCVFSTITLALPITLLLTLFMTRGASTQPNRTALFIGLAGGSWGAFTYALQCPYVGLYYLAAWYVGGIALVTIAARLVLPRLARW